jgi:hypothetical protein
MAGWIRAPKAEYILQPNENAAGLPATKVNSQRTAFECVRQSRKVESPPRN